MAGKRLLKFRRYNQGVVQSGRSIDLDSIDVGSNPATLTMNR